MEHHFIAKENYIKFENTKYPDRIPGFERKYWLVWGMSLVFAIIIMLNDLIFQSELVAELNSTVLAFLLLIFASFLKQNCGSFHYIFSDRGIELKSLEMDDEDIFLSPEILEKVKVIYDQIYFEIIFELSFNKNGLGTADLTLADVGKENFNEMHEFTLEKIKNFFPAEKLEIKYIK